MVQVLVNMMDDQQLLSASLIEIILCLWWYVSVHSLDEGTIIILTKETVDIDKHNVKTI